MSTNETGPPRRDGQAADGRIRLDYYKTLDPLSRGKGWLSAAAAVAVAAWVSGLGLDARHLVAAGRSGRSPWSTPGRSPRAHATWDAECEACHVPFTPIDGSAWTARFVGRRRARRHALPVVPRRGRTTTRAGRRRPTRRRARAATATTAAGRRRSSLDGRPELHPLPRRARVARPVGAAVPRVVASVTRFDADRATTRSSPSSASGPPEDPGRLKFNHALHMTRGLTLEPGRPCR